MEEKEVMLTEATTSQLGPCQVRSKTEHPCPNRAVVEIRGIPFCKACAREQEAYFAIGELDGRAPGQVPRWAENPEVQERVRTMGAVEVVSKAASLEEILAAARRLGRKVGAVHEDQKVSDMVDRVLSRQAKAHAERTGEPFGAALEAVLKTEAGRRLGELRGGPDADKAAARWQEGLAPKRANERRCTRREERSRALEDAAWKLFMQEELLELELRKDGQLAELLGGPLQGELPAQLRRLASEDQRQAEEGLVALTIGGKVSYKHLDDLTQQDRPARIASNRLRTTWLKDNRDGWLSHVEEPVGASGWRE
jgi:hypothetical protein